MSQEFDEQDSVSTINSENDKQNQITNLNDRNKASTNIKKYKQSPLVVVNNGDKNSKDFDKDKFNKKSTKAMESATDNLFKLWENPLEQQNKLHNLIKELSKINTTFENIVKEKDKEIKETFAKIDTDKEEKQKKYKNEIKKLNPLKIEFKSRANDYEKFLINIMNKLSIDENGNVYSDLPDFYSNLNDIREYCNKLDDICNKEDTPMSVKQELSVLKNELQQVIDNGACIGGVNSVRQAVREMIHSYNQDYSTRSFFSLCLDFIKNFFGTIFGLFTVEHSYKEYNRITNDIQDALNRIKSPDIKIAKQAREDLIKSFEELTKEQYYTVGKEFDKEQFEKLKKLVGTVIKEENNIDNTDLLKQLITIGGKFNINKVMNNLGLTQRAEFKRNMKKFVIDNILPKNLQDRDKCAEYFITGKMFKKIDDITDDDKKSIENIWGGLIEQNQKIFTLKKYSEDTEKINVFMSGYNNLFEQDKISAATTINIKYMHKYLDEVKKQRNRYGIIVSEINLIQRLTGVNCYNSFKDVFDEVEKNFDANSFRENLIHKYEKDTDVYDVIYYKKDKETYQERAKKVLSDLIEDEKTNKAKGSDQADYNELYNYIAKKTKKLKDETQIPNYTDLPKIEKIPQNQNKTMNDLLKDIKNDVIEKDLLKELFKQYKEENHFRQMGGFGGRGGGFGGGYQPF